MSATAIEIMSVKEQADLAYCEAIIEKNFKAFEVTGNCLLQIRDNRLYRCDFPTFQDYCRERWQIGRSHAYRLIEAAEVVQAVPEVENERQAREIAKFDKPLQKQIYELAQATAPNGEVTGEWIHGIGDLITAIIQDGGLDDGSGQIQPIGILAKANVTEFVFERMKRQEEAIKEKREKKTRTAIANGIQKDIPAQPINHAMFWLLRSLIRGIEYANKDRNTKLHPALHDCFYLGKALIGESVTEMTVVVDPVSVEGVCDRCPSRSLPVKEVTITTNIGSMSSSRLLLCGVCLDTYVEVLASTDAEVL